MPFLNSGTYIGPVHAIKQMLHAIEKDIQKHFAFPTGGEISAVNDQRWFWRYWLMNQESMIIDSKSKLFHTLHGTKPDDYHLVSSATGTIWSNITNTMPSLVHGNGEGKDALNAIVAMLYSQDWLVHVTQTEQYHGSIEMMK